MCDGTRTMDEAPEVEPDMTGAEIVALSKAHTITEYVPQNAVNPIPVARAKGVYFWTPEGQRFIDFNSQLMSVNIGHGDPRVIAAIAEQAEKVTYVASALTTEARARLGAKLAEITPGDIDVFFFTNGGAEANENAFKIARAVTGRQKILARYRSYHGGTAGAHGGHGRAAQLEPAAAAGIRPCARSVSRHRAGMGRRRDVAAVSRGSHSARRAADDRGVHPRDGDRRQRHPRPAGRLPARVCARSATSTAS